MVPIHDFRLLSLSIDLRWQPVGDARHPRVQLGSLERLGHWTYQPWLFQHLLPAVHENVGNRSKVRNDRSDPPLPHETILFPKNLHETELHRYHDYAGYERS